MSCFCMIMCKDIFMLKQDALLEVVIENLALIMLTFKQGLAHVPKIFC